MIGRWRARIQSGNRRKHTTFPKPPHTQGGSMVLDNNHYVIKVIPGPGTGEEILIDEEGTRWHKVRWFINASTTGERRATLHGREIREK